MAVITGSTGKQVSRAPGATPGHRGQHRRRRQGRGRWRADAFVSDDISLIDQARLLKGTVKVVGPRMSVEPWHRMVPKNARTSRQNLVNQAMKDMYRDGTARQDVPQVVRAAAAGARLLPRSAPDRLLSDTFRRPDDFVTDWTVL